jgi:hypothetical protein
MHCFDQGDWSVCQPDDAGPPTDVLITDGPATGDAAPDALAYADASPSDLRVQSRCGDRVVDPGEDCDNGAMNSANAYGDTQCTDKCKRAPYCGDSVTNGPERCDSGGAGSFSLGACNPECSGFYEKKYLRETQNLYPASMGGILGADMTCRAEFGAAYKALLVGGGRRATTTPLKGDNQSDWVLRQYTHYYNALDQLVWRTDELNLLGVRDGRRMNLYAKAFTGSQYPWCGYGNDWTTIPDAAYSGTCMGWTYGGADQQGSFCFEDLTNAAGEPCTGVASILCVEQ